MAVFLVPAVLSQFLAFVFGGHILSYVLLRPFLNLEEMAAWYNNSAVFWDERDTPEELESSPADAAPHSADSESDVPPPGRERRGLKERALEAGAILLSFAMPPAAVALVALYAWDWLAPIATFGRVMLGVVLGIGLLYLYPLWGLLGRALALLAARAVMTAEEARCWLYREVRDDDPSGQRRTALLLHRSPASGGAFVGVPLRDRLGRQHRPRRASDRQAERRDARPPPAPAMALRPRPGEGGGLASPVRP